MNRVENVIPLKCYHYGQNDLPAEGRSDDTESCYIVRQIPAFAGMTSLKEVFLQGFCNCSAAGMNFQLFINMADVCINRMIAEKYFFGDLLFA